PYSGRRSPGLMNMRGSLRGPSAPAGAGRLALEDERPAQARWGARPLGGVFMYPTETPSEELVFLADLSDEEAARIIQYTAPRRVRRGDVIVRAGEFDRSLGIVVDGTLELFLAENDKPILSIGAHSIVGEMAFLDARPRSATIRARTDGELLRLTFA